MKENFTLADWLDDTIAEKDLAQLKLEDDFLVLEKIKKYSANLQTQNFSTEDMLEAILKADKPIIPIQQANTIRQNPFSSLLKIAAVLVLGLGIWFTYNKTNLVMYYANNGTRTSFVLPDNSEVTLNAGSQITYKRWNWNSNRNLNLKGEAFFKVAKGEKFTVHTTLGKVSVLGTQFNVKSRDTRLDVSCFEGKVAVSYGNQTEKITKGQSISVEKDQKINLLKINQTQPYWLNNKLFFEKVRLKDLLQEVERQFNVTIKYNQNISDQLFTGELPANNLSLALKMISTTYGIKIDKKANNNYELIKSFENK